MAEIGKNSFGSSKLYQSLPALNIRSILEENHAQIYTIGNVIIFSTVKTAHVSFVSWWKQVSKYHPVWSSAEMLFGKPTPGDCWSKWCLKGLSWWDLAWMTAIKDFSSSLVCFLVLVCYSGTLRVFGYEILLWLFFSSRQEPLPVGFS